jgi:signal transduction histidine kinase
MGNVSPSTDSQTPIEPARGARAPLDPGGGAACAGAPSTGPPPGEHPLARTTVRAPGEEPFGGQHLLARYAEVSQLAGGLAHEIRNPLSTLSLNLDLLLEDFQNPETLRDRRVLQRVERLRHEVARLLAILENFLRFARVQDLKLEPTDLNSLIDELRDFSEPQAATKGIVIRTSFAADLPLIRIDRDLFKQALLNLVLNAQHAMPSGGDLILTTRLEQPWVVLDVIDTGVGMPEEVRSRIFEAFFSTRAEGSGLGLPTTRKIIEAHGGSIQVQTEPGKGSRFSIRLPACQEGRPEGAPPEDQESPPARPSHQT